MSDAEGERWSVVIVSSRETPDTLMETIAAAIEASASHDTTIDIIVNGNRPLADLISGRLSTGEMPAGRDRDLDIRLWFIAQGDKAHTWNTYFHDIWPGSAIAFFVDGYASVSPNAFDAMAAAFEAAPDALAASAVPSVGRSAERMKADMIREKGMHGSLFALRRAGIEGLRTHGFRLPLGMYRSDGTIAAAIKFRFDPGQNKWDESTIIVVPEATWRFRPLKWWQLVDIKTQYKRMLRLAFGRLAIAAVRDTFSVRRQPVSALPREATEMVRAWMAEHPEDAKRILRQNPLWILERGRLIERKDWSRTALPPELLLTWPASTTTDA